MVGQTIGKYRIVDRLGRGGMGTVYRAVDETLHREVAIKVLNAELNDPGVGRRFRAEAVAIARLNHPGIALIYELVQHEGQWLMVIEYIRGETLESLLTRSGPLTTAHAAELTIQVLSALAHAHSMGVVHRDLKPQNIMITEAGVTKVMDFGIARVAGTEHLTSAGFLMGTPAYMAPEQVMGGEIDTRTDLFSVGVVLYHLLTGRLPFKGETPMAMAQSRIRDLPTPIRAIRQDLPAWMSIIMERALERAADRRYQSADEMRDALRRGLTGLPVAAPGPLLTPPELIATVPPGSPTWATHPPLPANPTGDFDSAAATVIVPPTRSERLAPAGSAAPAGVTAPAPASPGPIEPAAAAPGPVEPPAAAPAPPSRPADPANAPSKTLNAQTVAMIAAGVVVVLIGGGLVVRALRNQPPAAPPAPPPPAAAAPPAVVEAPPPTDPAAPASPAATVTPPPPATGAPGSRGAPISPGTPPGATAGTGTGPAPGTGTGRGTGVPPATSPGLPPTAPGRVTRGVAAPPANPADIVARFDAIKHLEVVGRTGTERDAAVYFGGGLISLVTRTGASISTMQYRDLVGATHIRAKDPKWDESLPGPPTNVDVPGGMFRPLKHWLTLQSRTTYLVLRLEDDSWKNIVDTLEARTGIRVALASR